MPTLKKGESKKDWMKRCVPMLRREGREAKQAIAICISMFKRKK